MKALVALSRANALTLLRDRQAMLWMIVTPLLFIVLFGTILNNSGDPEPLKVGWSDADRSPASAALRDFVARSGAEITDGSVDDLRPRMAAGDLDGVVVVPASYAEAMAGEGRADVIVRTDPSQQADEQSLVASVDGALRSAEQSASGRPQLVTLSVEPLQGGTQNGLTYLMPSILAMSLMQLGIYGAIPLVQLREKRILVRLSATPLRRATFVASNLVVRIALGAVQAVLLVGLGVVAFHVPIAGNLAAVAALVVLGAAAFTGIGYVVASFVTSEESATVVTGLVSFPLMFLSGIFFPVELMPEFVRPVAALLPLTYLGDALRQALVGATPYVPMLQSVAILAGWLAVSFLISARFFRWDSAR